MRLGALAYLYARRVRTHPIQELLAGAGIAIGVALVFAVIVANTSLEGSASQIASGIAGNARVELLARDQHGFDDRLIGRVRALHDVAHATALLEQRAVIEGPHGRESVVLVGVDPSLGSLGGSLTHGFGPAISLALRSGVMLPSGLATRLRLPASSAPAGARTIRLRLRGRALRAPVGAVLGPELVGPLSNAMVAVARIGFVQAAARLPHRVTRILVEPRPGHDAAVRHALQALAGPGVAVTSPDVETRRLDQATGPNDQSTNLFAAISALVGLLLAFNAMLLTGPERRRSVAELRLQGFAPRQIVMMLAFQAAVLGVAASTAGVLLGALLARTVFGTLPTYLSFAFPLGTQRVIRPETVVLAFGGGVLATALAAAQPLTDLRSRRAVDAVYREGGEPGQSLSAAARRVALVAALVLFAVTTAVLLLVPSATMAGIAALAIATLLAMPILFSLAVRATTAVGRGTGLTMVAVAGMALRAATMRSIALAATGAVAIFGSVAIEGAHHDLVRGLDRAFAQYLGTADLWVTTGGDDLTTESFPAADAIRRLRGSSIVADVRPYYGGLLDVGSRRAWVIARSPGARMPIPPSQVVDGNAATGSERVDGRGWVAVSAAIAHERGAAVGGRIALPTPSGPRAFRVAATLTNMGWGPGAIVMNGADWREAWRTSDPTAIEVDLAPGVDADAARAALQQALGPHLALRVQTRAERLRQYEHLARQGLDRLSEISALLLIAAALALAAASAAAIWQRRGALAAHRLQGFAPAQLWTALLLEAGIVLGVGCVTGAATGVYGHLLLGRWLRLTTGFPAPFSIAGWQTLETFAAVALAAAAMIAVPSYLAARVSPRVALQE